MERAKQRAGIRKRLAQQSAIRGVALLLSLLLLGGCLQSKEPVRVVVENEVQTRLLDADGQVVDTSALMQRHQALGTEVPGYGMPVRALAEQMEAALNKHGIKTLTLTVTPFVDLQQPREASNFGMELADGLYHELQSRGFNLIDYQVIGLTARTSELDDDEARSKQPLISHFYQDHRINYVVTGNYFANSDGVVIRSRVLDTVTRQVVASGQSHMPRSALEGDYPGYNPLRVREGMIIENGGVPEP